jgi:ribosomal peptide maturation radical SAM protein 1
MDVVFAVMPFADLRRPAIGVSLLKAAAVREGYSAKVEYCCFSLAGVMGHDNYQQISNSYPPDILLGEWFFADDLFGDEIPPEEEYLEKILAPLAPLQTIDDIRKARRSRSQYLDDIAGRLAAQSPTVVGFTTTFHQTCASLAVARRLKRLPNPPIIVFGGANCEGEMGLQLSQSFPWVDFVCCGESDISFVMLLHHLLRGGPAEIPGVLKQGQSREVSVSEMVKDMDTLPVPDFDDYFDQLEKSGIGSAIFGSLVVETSRGCWWGAKHHCTFCGLNGATMAYRSKSPDRAMDEIVSLCRKHGLARVCCVDNILDMRYIDTLFPRLAECGLEMQFFYEVKSNLRFEQLVKLHRGGLRQIQPGIESFSDQVLRLMDKGVTGFQNIQLLRWCEELGIDCVWNVIAGFPGEEESEYARMAQLVPLLTHLNPPSTCTTVRLDRFSPFHSRAETFGFKKIRPARAYFFVFPLGRKELSRLAYFFDFDYDDSRNPNLYMEPLAREVERWFETRCNSERPSRLDAHFDGPKIRVTDTRDVARNPSYHLTGLRARLLALCDVSATMPQLLRRAELPGQEPEVRSALESLVADGLVAHEDGHYLTLAVFRNRSDYNRIPQTDAYLAISETAASEPLFRVV